MKKIDTYTWKSVPLTDLFEPVLSEGDNKANRLEDGDIPLISSGSFNNGIAKMVKEGDGVSKMFTGNVLTIDMFGKAFYQPNPFLTVSHGRVNILLPKFEMTPAIGLFFATLLNREYRDKYSFTTMCNQNQLLNESLIIPWKDNQPDFAYMEQYIRSLEQRVQTTLTNYEQLIQWPKHAVDTTQWKTYKIGDLFMAQNTGNILTRDISDGSGTTPFVTASAINNGVAAYIDASKYTILKGHCILVGGKTFTLTYQKDDFVSNDSHNFTLRLKGDNPYSNKIYLFLLTLLRTTLGQKYSWGDAVTKEKILENEIMLPATSDGSPDFAYMEQYIKEIEQRVQQNLDKIA